MREATEDKDTIRQTKGSWLDSPGIAFSMYSRFPVPQVQWTEAGMKYAICFFPLVGVAVGGCVAFFAFLAFPNRLLKDMTDAAHPVSFAPETEHGLTETGIAFVQEMERLGMIIDVSHLGDAGIWDVFRYTKKPFVASHSNARALARHPRNLTDEMIRALGERGGVAGINFCAAFLRDEEDGAEPVNSYCRDMVAHMKHMKQIGGIGCIGLGTDFDGIGSRVELVDCSGMQMLAHEMSREGFTTGEIEAVFHGNVLRLYKELL